jgi:MoaA/NifB/PqqE/SkfB family radical SAM enzyme
MTQRMPQPTPPPSDPCDLVLVKVAPGEWCGVVDQAASAHPAFYFSGGEPLLYRGLDQVLAHVKRRGLIAALVTNGSLLARHAERLVEIGVDNVTVSLDGPEAVHDAIRGVPGTFARARVAVTVDTEPVHIRAGGQGSVRSFSFPHASPYWLHHFVQSA